MCQIESRLVRTFPTVVDNQGHSSCIYQAIQSKRPLRASAYVHGLRHRHGSSNDDLRVAHRGNRALKKEQEANVSICTTAHRRGSVRQTNLSVYK